MAGPDFVREFVDIRIHRSLWAPKFYFKTDSLGWKEAGVPYFKFFRKRTRPEEPPLNRLVDEADYLGPIARALDMQMYL